MDRRPILPLLPWGDVGAGREGRGGLLKKPHTCSTLTILGNMELISHFEGEWRVGVAEPRHQRESSSGKRMFRSRHLLSPPPHPTPLHPTPLHPTPPHSLTEHLKIQSHFKPNLPNPPSQSYWFNLWSCPSLSSTAGPTELGP